MMSRMPQLRIFFAWLALFMVPHALAKPAQWIAVQSPLFTIYTPAGEKTARRWAVELEQFRRAMQLVVSVPESSLRPVTVMLFPTDKEMRPFKPLENGKPQRLAGFFVHGGDYHALALSLDDDEEAETRRTIFHEAVHWYSSAADQSLPMWLEEGVAEVYSTFRAEGEKVSFGWPLQHHLRALARGEKYDVGRHLLTARGTLEYNEGNRATLFYARSWLMAHYLLYGKGSPGRAAVARYLDGLSRQSDLELAFREAFGCTYAEFGQQLANYLKGGRHIVQQMSVPTADIAASLKVRPATEAELECAKGTLLLGARDGDPTQALPYLLRATVLAPDSASAWQMLGEAKLVAKDQTGAGECFSRAVAAGSTSYYVHYGLALASLEGADRLGGTFDPDEADRSAKSLRRALELNPRFVPAYESLAGLILAMPDYDPSDRTRLERGARLAPDNAWIDIGLALADIREGHAQRARQRLDLALEDHKTPPDLRRFVQQVQHGQEWVRVEKEITARFDQKDFSGVVALIDEVRPRFPETQLRRVMEINRRTAQAADRLTRAVELANSGRSAAARQLLEDIIASDADGRDKIEARRILDLLK